MVGPPTKTESKKGGWRLGSRVGRQSQSSFQSWLVVGWLGRGGGGTRPRGRDVRSTDVTERVGTVPLGNTAFSLVSRGDEFYEVAELGGRHSRFRKGHRVRGETALEDEKDE